MMLHVMNASNANVKPKPFIRVLSSSIGGVALFSTIAVGCVVTTTCFFSLPVTANDEKPGVSALK